MARRLEEKCFFQIGENDHALALQFLRLVMGIQTRDDSTLLTEFSAVNHLANQFVCLGMFVRLPIIETSNTHGHNASNNQVKAPERIRLLNSGLSRVRDTGTKHIRRNVESSLRSILGLVKGSNKVINTVLQSVNRFHFLLFLFQRTNKVVNAILVFLKHDLQCFVFSTELGQSEKEMKQVLLRFPFLKSVCHKQPVLSPFPNE